MLGVNPQHKDHIEQKQVHVLYINLEQAQEEVEKRFVSCFSALNDLDRAIAYSDIMNPSEIKNWQIIILHHTCIHFTVQI